MHPQPPPKETKPPNCDIGRNPVGRAIAAILWAGFMGAVLMMPVFIWATHHLDSGLGLMTRLFVASWAICCLPAAIGWLLARELPAAKASRNGQ